jgi:hypothetical protein
MMLPKSKEDQALEIFNQLVHLDVGDVEEAVRLLFRLRTIDTGYPNPTTKVSRADAALIAGYRQEAINCLNEVSRLSVNDDLAVLQRLQLLQMLVGHTVSAVALAKDLIEIPGAVNENTVVNLIVTALWSGDLSLLASIEEKEEKTGSSLATGTIDILKEAGIDTIISEHQRILRDVLQDYQISIWSRVDETEESCVVNLYYFDGTLANRKMLERQIDQALDAHYRGKGMKDSDWRSKIMTIITEAPRHTGVDLATGKAA